MNIHDWAILSNFILSGVCFIVANRDNPDKLAGIGVVYTIGVFLFVFIGK